jgi:hypothetical protein
VFCLFVAHGTIVREANFLLKAQAMSGGKSIFISKNSNITLSN